MSFYRSLLATVAAIAISSPLFAEDTGTLQNNVEMAPTAQTTDASTTTETKVNVNQASAKDLMKVKGINAAKARALIAYRKKHGEFKSVDDISHVKGFKKMKSNMLKSIEAQLSVG